MRTYNKILLLTVFMVLSIFNFTYADETQGVEGISVPSELILEHEKSCKVDLVEHYSNMILIRTVIYRDLINKDIDMDIKKDLNLQLDELDEYNQDIVKKMFNEEKDFYEVTKVAKRILNKKLDGSTLESFLLYPLVEKILSSKEFIAPLYESGDLISIRDLNRKISKYLNTNHYEKLLDEINLKDEELLTVSQVGGKSVKVFYYDRENHKVINKYVFPGSIIGNIKILSILKDGIELFNLNTKATFTKKYSKDEKENLVVTDLPFMDRKQYKIVSWFDDINEYSVKKGGVLNLLLKVIDEKGLTLKPVTLNLDGKKFESDQKGMITVKIDTDLFEISKNTFTVSLNPDVKADFNVDIQTMDMQINYTGSIGGDVGIGLDAVAADVTAGIGTNASGSILFVSPDINNIKKDVALYSVNPSIKGSLSASVGPKVKPLDISVFGKNIGAGAGATVGASASLSVGVKQQYKFGDPYKKDRKGQSLLLLDKLLKVNGPLGYIAANTVKRISGVDVSDYQIYGGLTIKGSIGVNGNIGGSLGLVDTDDKGDISSTAVGVSAQVVSGSATLSTGIEGGLISGDSVFGPTDDRYSVTLTSGLSGSFSAMNFSGKILNKNLIPKWWLVNTNGNVGATLINRFDKDFKFSKSILVLTMGYKFNNNLYDEGIMVLKELLKKDGASGSDYAELFDAQGMTKVYIFIFDKTNAKYFEEWIAFSRTILTKDNPQNQQTVVRKVKGLFAAIGQSLKKLTDNPVFFIEKTDLMLKQTSPEIGFKVSLGVKVNLGVSTQFSKNKSFVDRVGYISGGKIYEIEKYGYSKEIARADREITYLLNQIRYYVQEEVEKGADYVIDKTKDGVIYISQKLADGTVYVITKAADGTVKAAKYVGEKAKSIWKGTVNAVSSAAEYAYDKGSNFVSGVGNAISTAWNYWF